MSTARQRLAAANQAGLREIPRDELEAMVTKLEGNVENLTENLSQESVALKELAVMRKKLEHSDMEYQKQLREENFALKQAYKEQLRLIDSLEQALAKAKVDIGVARRRQNRRQNDNTCNDDDDDNSKDSSEANNKSTTVVANDSVHTAASAAAAAPSSPAASSTIVADDDDNNVNSDSDIERAMEVDVLRRKLAFYEMLTAISVNSMDTAPSDGMGTKFSLSVHAQVTHASMNCDLWIDEDVVQYRPNSIQVADDARNALPAHIVDEIEFQPSQIPIFFYEILKALYKQQGEQ